MQERHRAGALLLLVLFTMGLNFMAVAPLLPLIQAEYGVSQTMVGLLIGAVSLMLALGMTPGGIIISRLGVKKALAIGAALLSGGALIPLAPDFSIVLALRVVFSLGATLVIPGSSVLIMQWFSQRELPIWNAGAGAIQSLGMTISLFLAAPLAEAFGWRVPLAIYGSAAIAGAAIWVLFGREKTGAAGPAPNLGMIAGALRERTTIVLTLGFFGPIGQFTALTGLLPTYYSVERGLSLSEAGAITSLLSLLGIPGTIMGGILPQRYGVRKPFVLGCGAIVGVSGACSYMLPTVPLMTVAVLVVGVCSWLYFPVLTTIAMELPGMTPAKVGVVLAAAIGLGNFSGFVAPLIVGILRDTTGSLLPGLLVWAVASMSLLVAGLLLPETGPRGKRAAQEAVQIAQVKA